MSHMMVTENLQKLHKICFGTFSMIFIFHHKIDLIECEPHFVKLYFLWTSSIVKVFDFLTFDILWYLKYNLQFLDIFDIFWTSWHLLTSWYLTFHLKHLSPSQGYFSLFHLSSMSEIKYWIVSCRTNVTSLSFAIGTREKVLLYLWHNCQW